MAGPDPDLDVHPLATVAPGVVPVLPAGTMNGVALEAHLEVAAATGHEMVSLRPRHIRAWTATGPGHTTDDLAARLAAFGLGVAELDPVTGWDDPRRWPTVELPADVLDDLDLAAAVGARAVTALVMPGEPWVPEAGVDGLGLLAAAADERGLAVQVEPFAWSALWDLVEAAEVVARCGAPNAGVLVDNWHLQRRGGSATTLDAVPVEAVIGVQLSDAVEVGGLGPDQLAADSSNRLFPGDPNGGLQPEAVLASLLRRGWTGPVAIEVFAGEPTDPLERARRAADSFRAVVTVASSRGRTIDG
jgi:4-hydroxyphenylpyruvate dioxygenase